MLFRIAVTTQASVFYKRGIISGIILNLYSRNPIFGKANLRYAQVNSTQISQIFIKYIRYQQEVKINTPYKGQRKETMIHSNCSIVCRQIKYSTNTCLLSCPLGCNCISAFWFYILKYCVFHCDQELKEKKGERFSEL